MINFRNKKQFFDKTTLRFLVNIFFPNINRNQINLFIIYLHNGIMIAFLG